jgi:uncharacterized membrane protein
LFYIFLLFGLIAAILALFARFDLFVRKFKIPPDKHKAGKRLILGVMAGIALLFAAVHKGYYNDTIPLPAPFNTTFRVLFPFLLVFLWFIRQKFPDPDRDAAQKAAFKKYILGFMAGLLAILLIPFALGALRHG